MLKEASRVSLGAVHTHTEKIAKASQEWEYLRGDEAVKRMAFLKEKWERDWNSGMHSAEEAGIEKGMKKGIKKGKREEKKEIAIKMIHEKIDEEIISKVTNLSLDEIEKLKEEINIKYIYRKQKW